MSELGPEAAARIAPLVGIGGQSGDTVVGLSAVRRAGGLAYIFVGAGVSAGTVRQLGRQGAQVLRVGELSRITGALGRADASVIGIKHGPLAEGITRRLAESGRREQQAQI